MKRLVLAAAGAEDSGVGSVIPRFNNMKVAVKTGRRRRQAAESGRSGDGLTVGLQQLLGKPRQLEGARLAFDDVKTKR